MTGLTQGGPAYTIAYDWMHNTTSYKAGTTTLAAFTYDGDGTRVTKTGNGTTTVYHTDKEGKTITETDTSGNLIADYVYVNGKLAAKKEPTSLFFYHTDPAGTPLSLTNSTGAIAWKADYKPFGEEQITVATKDNYKMFVGKEKDKETGLYYFGARYMQDKTARFVSVDPVGPVDEKSGKANERLLLNPQKLNRYTYAINNPYRYVDPKGRDVYTVGVGVSFFFSNIGPNTKDNKGGQGTQASFGIAFDTESKRFMIFGSGRVNDPMEDKVLGVNAGVGITIGKLNGNFQDFLGESTEKSYTLVAPSLTEVKTSSGKEGVNVSFGGKGFGLSATSIKTETFDATTRIREKIQSVREAVSHHE